MGKEDGFSLVDVILSIGIIVLLFGGVFLVYFSILDVVNNTELRTAATSVLNKHLETIRNLPYEEVGTVGGIPAGIIPQTQTSTWENVTFEIRTAIRNIDDPFDGTLGGTPDDTAAADYKSVELTASCPSCARFVPFSQTTTVAPKSLESATANGTLIVNVFNANGAPVSLATVHIVNTNVTPTIDLTDFTNASGTLKLVDAPTSTQGYAIEVSLAGYSSEKTYAPGNPANPNPVKPHATVVERQTTNTSFAIDRVSTVEVSTSDKVCAATGNKSFSISGAKLIGTNPDVLKFSTSTQTDASGTKGMNNMEWDTYRMIFTGPDDLLGTIPLSPVAVNPNTAVSFRFVLQGAAPNALLVTVKNDATGQGITGANVNLSRTGFGETKITGRNSLTHTDWSGNQYTSQSGGIDADTTPGSLTLLLGGGGYPTSTTHWLISETIDVGGIPSTFYTLGWNPTSQPGGTGLNSLRLQLASNDDQSTWNFVGPDGTSGTYYTASGEAVSATHQNDRYLRYQVFLETADETVTPRLEDVTVEFSGPCVPPAQALFYTLDLGTYTLDVTASGFVQETSTVDITGAWQQVEVLMSPQ